MRLTRPLAAAALALAALGAAAPLLAPSLGVARAQGPAAAPPKAAPARPAELSDVVKAKRPQGGEFFGAYLMNKKVGYYFMDMVPVPGHPDQVRFTSETVVRARLGTVDAERFVREERDYEARPGGRLLRFRLEQRGDGGNQTMEGTSTATGLRVVRKRPGLPHQVLSLPATKETVEDADQVRVAVLRRKPVDGTITDAVDLEQYRVRTTYEGAEERTLAGVRTRVHKAVTVGEKEKVPVTFALAESGAVVEFAAGPQMVARAEPEAVAKKLDQVELFSLVRLPLPRPLPREAQAVPGSVKLVLTGLPDKFQRATYRQQYRRVGEGRTEVTLSAGPPARRAARPVADPEGGKNVRSTPVVESDDPEIRKLAQRVVGDEQDAYAAAKKINAWVAANVQDGYGTSADRAADVLRQMKGDCTEHALLAVALLRASGIPARRVDGVAYLVNADGVPAMYWHQWVEAFVGEWTQLDPTFNQPVADATHFQLGEEGKSDVVEVMGQVKVVDAR